MITLKRAKVKGIKRKRPGYIEAVVDVEGNNQRAICYSSLIGEVQPGDDVIINATAVDLGLGTGGYHFVLWNLMKESIKSQGSGHIMKLRYTPMQIKCLAIEENDSLHHETLKEVSSIEGMPVIIGALHSQLPAATVTIKELMPQVKIAYVMTDGAALPLALSELVAKLKDSDVIDTTITVGHAFGGDIEAINVFSGLAAAKYAAGADIAVVCMGPGIVGSGTKLGFTGIEQGQVINAVNGLEGVAIAIPRISFVDKRERHLGISHHTITALMVAAVSPAIVTLPEMDEEKEKIVDGQVSREGLDTMHTIKKINAGITLGALRSRGILPTTMGRTIDEEPEFFMAAGAAGIYAVWVIGESVVQRHRGDAVCEGVLDGERNGICSC
ncbi:MAG: DUF3866 family protein [Actinobacteria bacterium]|nr:DUF3866 family protein [Actinomycetota bacterium]